MHSELQNQLFWGGTAYPTTHTQYSVCIIPYANMPDFGQRAPCQIHLWATWCFRFSAAQEFQKRLISRKERFERSNDANFSGEKYHKDSKIFPNWYIYEMMGRVSSSVQLNLFSLSVLDVLMSVWLNVLGISCITCFVSPIFLLQIAEDGNKAMGIQFAVFSSFIQALVLTQPSGRDIKTMGR